MHARFVVGHGLPYVLVTCYLGPTAIARIAYITSAASSNEEAVKLVLEYREEAGQLVRDLRASLAGQGKLQKEHLQAMMRSHPDDAHVYECSQHD